MTDKTFLVRFKPRELGLKAVIAARAEIHGEHIALLNSKGKLAALFLVEIVQSWNVAFFVNRGDSQDDSSSSTRQASLTRFILSFRREQGK
jgi:hypothetical protein